MQDISAGPVQATIQTPASSSRSHPPQDEELPFWPPKKKKPPTKEFLDLQALRDECIVLQQAKAKRAEELTESLFPSRNSPLKLTAKFSALDRNPK